MLEEVEPEADVGPVECNNEAESLFPTVQATTANDIQFNVELLPDIFESDKEDTASASDASSTSRSSDSSEEPIIATKRVRKQNTKVGPVTAGNYS